MPEEEQGHRDRPARKSDSADGEDTTTIEAEIESVETNAPSAPNEQDVDERPLGVERPGGDNWDRPPHNLGNGALQSVNIFFTILQQVLYSKVRKSIYGFCPKAIEGYS